MNQNQAIEVLKEEAKKNPVANAVFHVFATRQRTRQVLTVDGLTQRMKAEGFSHKHSDYEPILKLLADLGFGTLQMGRGGRIEGLKDIKKTLQSIGSAACDKPGTIKNFAPRAKYSQVLVKEHAQPKVEAPVGLAIELGTSLSLSFNGKPLQVTLPKDISSDELTKLIDGFRALKAM